jgi:hypothetical protein
VRPDIPESPAVVQASNPENGSSPW